MFLCSMCLNAPCTVNQNHRMQPQPPPQPSTEFIALCANSTPTNVAAFAGMALAMAGPNPGKKAFTPPLLYNPDTTPEIVGRPSAVCILDLMVSTGKTGIH